MRNITFDNVVVTNPGMRPWHDSYYYCEGIEGISTGGTQPVPPCFKIISTSKEEEKFLTK